jgi:hypothetical protein
MVQPEQCAAQSDGTSHPQRWRSGHHRGTLFGNIESQVGEEAVNKFQRCNALIMTVANTTRRYSVSPLQQGAVIVGIVVLAALVLGVLTFVWSSDNPMHEATGFTLPFLGLCYFLHYLGRFYARIYDCVLATEQALIYEPAKGMPVTLPWEEVVGLAPDGWNRRYDVLDRQGRCRMKISYDLDNFPELDATLREHLQNFSATASTTTWFTKTAGGQTFFTLGAGILALSMLGLYLRGQNPASLVCMVISVGFIPYGLYYRIEKVTVTGEGLIIHYWKRNRTISYTAIKKLSMQDEYIPGAWRTICLERFGHRPMKIEWIADEAMSFYQAMEAAWKQASLSR